MVKEGFLLLLLCRCIRFRCFIASGSVVAIRDNLYLVQPLALSLCHLPLSAFYTQGATSRSLLPLAYTQAPSLV